MQFIDVSSGITVAVAAVAATADGRRPLTARARRSREVESPAGRGCMLSPAAERNCAAAAVYDGHGRAAVRRG